VTGENMARFQFRFATLLRLREAARDERRQELAKAMEAEEIVRQRILQVEADLASLRERARAMAGPGDVDVDGLLDTQRFESVLRDQQRQLNEHQGTLRAEIERRRQAVVEANREVQILERLRQRQLERRREEENRREIVTLDEAARVGELRKRTVELEA